MVECSAEIISCVHVTSYEESMVYHSGEIKVEILSDSLIPESMHRKQKRAQFQCSMFPLSAHMS